jgi:Spy/CpxP family protein refolding chaperone
MTIFRTVRTAALASVLAGGAISAAGAADVVRHSEPGSHFPISTAIEVPPGRPSI